MLRVQWKDNILTISGDELPKLRTIVQRDTEVTHDIRTQKDEVEFNLVHDLLKRLLTKA